MAERTFAWVVRCRRLADDREFMTETSEAVIDAAMIRRVVRWLHPAE